MEAAPSSSSSSAPSALMLGIEDSALLHAREVISSKLLDPSSREEVPYLRAQLKKQLMAAESQLNHAVQNRLDAMKRAVDIIQDSRQKVEETFDLMQQIDKRIESTNTSISNFETLKRVHFARENLKKVIGQVEFFARVPERVSELMRVLEVEPHRLKEVYIESVKLDSLRKYILKEIKSQEHAFEKGLRRARKDARRKEQLRKIEDAQKRGLIVESQFNISMRRTDLENKWGLLMLVDLKSHNVFIDGIVEGSPASFVEPALRKNDIITKINGIEPSYHDMQDISSLLGKLYEVSLSIHRKPTVTVVTKQSNWFGSKNTAAKGADEAEILVLEEFSDDGEPEDDLDDDIIYTRPKRLDLSAEDQAEEYSSIHEVVDSHLSYIPELSKRIRRILWNNIENILDLAENSPADLVTTFEIVEMHQEYLDRLKVQKINKVLMANTMRDLYEMKFEDPDENDHDDDEDDIENVGIGGGLKALAISRLLKNLDDRIEGIFQGCAEGEGCEGLYSEEQIDEGLSDAQVTLAAGKQILIVMKQYVDEVVPCFPPTYNGIEVFLSAVEEYLVIEVTDALTNLPEDNLFIFNMINFLERFVAQVESYGFPNHDVCKKLRIAGNELIGEYRVRLNTQIMIWYGNIKTQPKEPIVSDGGILVTTVPEDVFNIIMSQIEVSRDFLSWSCLKDIISTCVEALSSIQRDIVTTIEQDYSELPPEILAASVNDNQRMQEKCGELSEKIQDLLPDNDEREGLITMLDGVQDEFIHTGTKAVYYLTRLIWDELEEPVVSQLYGPEWENGHEYAAIIVATVDDYFNDIKKWLPDFFYSKFVKEMLNTIVVKYVITLRHFCDQCDDSYRFESEITAAKIISNDMKVIEDFFLKQESYMRKAGAREDPVQALAEDMKAMKYLSQLVVANRMSSIKEVLEYFFDHWREDGLYIVKSASKLNPSTTKAEKLDNDSFVMKMYSKQPSTSEAIVGAISSMFKSADLLMSSMSKTTGAKKKKKKPKATKLSSYFTGK